MAAGPLAPRWAVEDAGVCAVAQHGAQAGVAAGGAALGGGDVLPAKGGGERGGVRTLLFPFCPDLSRFCFSPDVVGHLLLVAPLVAAADDEPDEEQQEQQEEDGADDRAHDHAHLVGGCTREEGRRGGGGRTEREAEERLRAVKSHRR